MIYTVVFLAKISWIGKHVNYPCILEPTGTFNKVCSWIYALEYYCQGRQRVLYRIHFWLPMSKFVWMTASFPYLLPRG